MNPDEPQSLTDMRIILLFALVLSASFAAAQYATPEVLSTTGGSAIVGDIDIAWTFGEAVVVTMEGDTNILTNGLHQTDEFCFGDFNFDGQISAADLLTFLSQFGCQSNCLGDLNSDDDVSSSDLLIFLSIYGTSCYGNI